MLRDKGKRPGVPSPPPPTPTAAVAAADDVVVAVSTVPSRRTSAESPRVA